jgi:glycosyltransferase involved in cell wall biosynthesis
MGRKAGKQIDFSIVVPVKDEVDLIPRTLPSYYDVNPREVIVCTDKPIPRKVQQVIQKVAVDCDATNITRIVEVKKEPEWNFHQAHVRRIGFKKAKYDRILTVDIDLVINKNVLKALKLVGENNVGLVSCVILRYPKSLGDLWRVGTITFLRKIVHGMLAPFVGITMFTGLYALWRPYWLDSEPEEKIKKHLNPKQFHRGEYAGNVPADVNPTGEDTHLKDCMLEKHRCIYLRDLGAIGLRGLYEDDPCVQYMTGQYFARRGRSLLVSVGRAFLRGQPDYLRGFLHQRNKQSSSRLGESELQR